MDFRKDINGLRAIAVIAVLLFHFNPGWLPGGFAGVDIFFVLSGYTARHVPWRILLPAGLRSLGVPFLCFSILLLGADFLIEGLRGVQPIFPGWWHGARTILFATEALRGPFTILWFIPCLFLARLAWNGLVANGRRADGWPVLAAMLVVAALAVAAQQFGTHSPLGLLAVPGALVMIWAGALWRHWGPPPHVLFAGFALLAVAALIWFPPVNMKLGDFGWPILSATAATAATITLARLVQSLPLALITAFAALGRASLVIMYAHVAFIHYLAPYAPRVALFVVALALSFAIDRVIRRARITRRLLLGEPKSLVKTS